MKEVWSYLQLGLLSGACGMGVAIVVGLFIPAIYKDGWGKFITVIASIPFFIYFCCRFMGW